MFGPAPKFFDAAGKEVPHDSQEAASMREEAGLIDPLFDLPVDDLAALATETKGTFNLKEIFNSRPEVHANPAVVQRVADAYTKYADSTKLLSLPSTVGEWKQAAGGLWDMAKGYAKTFAVGLPAAVVANVPGVPRELQMDAEKLEAEIISGNRAALQGLGNLALGAGEKLARATGLAPKLNELNAQQRVEFFQKALEEQRQLQKISEGKDEGFLSLDKGEMAKLAEAGRTLEPEQVAQYAAGSPLAFKLFGAGFGGAGKVVGAGARAVAPNLTARMVPVLSDIAAKTGGRVVERGAQAAELSVAGTQKVAPVGGAVAGGLGLTSVVPHAGGGIIGAGLGLTAGKALAKGLQPVRGALQTAAQVGREIAGKEAIALPVAQLGRDVLEAVPMAGAEIGKGLAFDAALSAAAETPEEQQGVGIGALFGLGGAALRSGMHVVSGQLIAPRAYGAAARISSNKFFPQLDAVHDAVFNAANEGVKTRVNAIRGFARLINPEMEVIFAGPRPAEGQPDPYFNALISLGMQQEQAKFYADQAGFHSPRFRDAKGVDRQLIVFRDVESAPHEVKHAMDDVMGASAARTRWLNMRRYYTPQEWDALGRQYASKLFSGERRWDPSAESWQSYVADVSGWGRAEAAEQVARQEFLQGGEAEGPISADQMRTALESVQDNWRDVLGDEGVRRVGELFNGAEISAESWDALFKHAGPAMAEPTGPIAKSAQVLGTAMELIGIDPLTGRTSEGGVPLRRGAVEAGRRETAESTKGKSAAPTAPIVTPRVAPGASTVAKTPTERDREADQRIVQNAPDTTLEGADQSVREMTGTLAEAAATGQGVVIEYRSAPGEGPAAATELGGITQSVSRPVRRRIIEAARNLPEEARNMISKVFAPFKLRQSRKGLQAGGWAPQVFAANAQKLAEFVATSSTPFRADLFGAEGVYPVDRSAKTFTVDGWRKLLDDAQTFSKNQAAGFTGSGEPLVVPKEPGYYAPPTRPELSVSGLDQPRADVTNSLFGLKRQSTGIVAKETQIPLNLMGQRVSEATIPGRVRDVEGPMFGAAGAKSLERAQKLGIEGEQVRETNPFRDELEAQINPPSFIEVFQWLNLEHMKKVELAPEQPQITGNTLTLTAGFSPGTEWNSRLRTAKDEEATAKGALSEALQNRADEMRASLRRRGKEDDYNYELASMPAVQGRSQLPKDFQKEETFSRLTEDERTLLSAWETAHEARNRVEAERPEGALTDFEARQAEERYHASQEARMRNFGALGVQYKPSPHPDAIESAATRDDKTGKIYTGVMHFESNLKYLEDHPELRNGRSMDDPVTPLQAWNKLPDTTDGFVDKKGNFLTRKEAEARALEINQIKEPQVGMGGLESDYLRSAAQFKPDVSWVESTIQDLAEGGKTKLIRAIRRHLPETVTPELLAAVRDEVKRLAEAPAAQIKEYREALDLPPTPKRDYNAEWATGVEQALGKDTPPKNAAKGVNWLKTTIQDYIENASYRGGNEEEVADAVKRHLPERMTPEFVAALRAEAKRLSEAGEPERQVETHLDATNDGYGWHDYNNPNAEWLAGVELALTGATEQKPAAPLRVTLDVEPDENTFRGFGWISPSGDIVPAKSAYDHFPALAAVSESFSKAFQQAKEAGKEGWQSDLAEQLYAQGWVRLGKSADGTGLGAEGRANSLQYLRGPIEDAKIIAGLTGARTDLFVRGKKIAPAAQFKPREDELLDRAKEVLRTGKGNADEIRTLMNRVEERPEDLARQEALGNAIAQFKPEKTQEQLDKEWMDSVDFSKYEVKPKTAQTPEMLFEAKRKSAKIKQEALPDSAAGEEINIVHLSDTPGLRVVDPAKMGAGKATPRDLRGMNKSFWFVGESPLGQDVNIFGGEGKHAYGTTIRGERIYDLRGDKDDVLGYFSEPNRGLADQSLIKQGYAGVMTDTPDGRQVVMLFKGAKVAPIEFAGGEKAPKGLRAEMVQFAPADDPNPRKIKAAIVWDPRTGKRWEGAMHFLALQKATADGVKPMELGQLTQGFIDVAGNKLTREEAFVRAQELEQLKPGEVSKSTGTLVSEETQFKPRDLVTPDIEKRLSESIVRFEDGTLKPVFHGTASIPFAGETLRTEGFQAHFGGPGSAAQRVLGVESNRTPKAREGVENLRTVPVFLDIKNPLRTEDAGNWAENATAVARVIRDALPVGSEARRWFREDAISGKVNDALADLEARMGVDKAWTAANREVLRDMQYDLMNEGYDGIVYKNTFEGEEKARIATNIEDPNWTTGGLHYPGKEDYAGDDSYIAFEPSQVFNAVTKENIATIQFKPAKLEDFSDKKKLSEALKSDGWAILTWNQEALGAATAKENLAANDRLAKRLTDAGYEFQEIKGSYEGVDQGKNFLVTGISPEEALALGQEGKQESVIVPDGLLYSDRTLYPIDPSKNTVGKNAKTQPGWSQVPGGPAFSLGLDFSEKISYEPKAAGQAQPALFEGFNETPERKVLSTSELATMGVKALRDYYPEATIPNRVRNRKGEPVDPQMPSDHKNSPLYKSAKDEAEAVQLFADQLVREHEKWKDNPTYQSGLKWYSEFTPLLKKHFGKDAPIMAELLSATSPNTTPDINFKFALDAILGYKAGRYDRHVKGFLDGLQKVEDGSWKDYMTQAREAGKTVAPSDTVPAFLEQWIADNNLLPLQSNGKKFGMHSVPVLKVLARKWLALNTGPKTANFIKNLVGTGEEATVDVWADRTLRRIGYQERGRWRITTLNSTGIPDADFYFGQKVFRAAADKLGIKPSALQGGMWFAEKQLWADRKWGRLDLGDFRSEIKKLKATKATLEARAKEAQPELLLAPRKTND
jgi:hypothetical protein